MTAKVEITEKYKNKAFKNAKNNNALVPGNVKMELLNYLKGSYHLFNRSEREEEIPSKWHFSYMSLLFKNGD